MPFIIDPQQQAINQVAFNAPRRPVISQEDIKTMSGGSLGEFAAKATQELSNYIDERDFENRIGKATESGDLSQLLSITPRNEKQAAILNQKTGMFKALQDKAQQDRLFQLQRDTSDLTKQSQAEAITKAQMENQLFADAFRRRQEEMDFNNQVAQNVASQSGLKSLSKDGKFNVFSGVNEYEAMPDLRRQDLKALGLEPKEFSQHSFKSLNYLTLENNLKSLYESGEIDEEEFNKRMVELKNNYEQMTLSGKKSVAQDVESSEYVANKNMGKQLLAGKTEYNADAARKATSDFRFTDNYTKAIKEKEEKYGNNKATIDSIRGLQASLGNAIKGGAFSTGVVANLQQAFGEMASAGFWRSLSGKTTEEIMTQARLQGEIGMEVAERLRDVSGLAATDGEFRRTLMQVIGGDFTQEDVKLEILNGFSNKIQKKNYTIARQLVDDGLPEYYEQLPEYVNQSSQAKNKFSISKSDMNSAVNNKEVNGTVSNKETNASFDIVPRDKLDDILGF